MWPSHSVSGLGEAAALATAEASPGDLFKIVHFNPGRLNKLLCTCFGGSSREATRPRLCHSHSIDGFMNHIGGKCSVAFSPGKLLDIMTCEPRGTFHFGERGEGLAGIDLVFGCRRF
jgi:hypothetical protein